MNNYGFSIWSTRANSVVNGKRTKLNGRPLEIWKIALASHQKDCPMLREGKQCNGCDELRERLAESEARA